MKIKILSFLLHHANRCTKEATFYAIKDKLLDRYGYVLGYDIQHVEGKKCYSCDGTGVYRKMDQYRIWNKEACWHCYGGWYKRPMWILLARKQFGQYIFHKPVKREYSVKNPFVPSLNTKVIEGYIDHSPHRYSELALYVLYLIYNRKAFKNYFLNHVGTGRRVYWYWPRNWFYHSVWLIRFGIPRTFRKMKNISWRDFIFLKPDIDISYIDENGNCELPF